MTLIFPDDAALRFAITGGVLADEVLKAPARTGVDDGRVWVEMPHPLPADTTALLSRVGIGIANSEPADGQHIDHWWQLFLPVAERSHRDLGPQTPVTFATKSEVRLQTLIQECLRLGNDRLAVRRLGNGELLLRVVGPPHYTLLAALDENDTDAPRAYREQVERLWVEFGWHQPLSEHLAIAEGRLMFVDRAGQWLSVSDEPFHVIDEVLHFAEPEQVTLDVVPIAAGEFDVPLRLVPGGTTGQPTLWVLRDRARAAIDALVASAENTVLNRWSFAEAGTIIIVRVRPGRTTPPKLHLQGLACREYARMANLYLPSGQRLDPPLRRDTLRTLLAADIDRVTWLIPSGDGNFEIESISDTAFRPLSEWPDAVLANHERAVIDEWIRATRFDFADYWQPDEPVKQRDAPSKPKAVATPMPKAAPPRPPSPRTQRLRNPRKAVRVDLPVAVPLAPTEARTRLAELERQFVQVGGALDAPARQALWPSLARLNAAANEPADAALAWSHALWMGEPADEHRWGWVWSEAALPQPELTAEDVDRLLAPELPTVSEIRAVAAAVTWAAHQQPVPATLIERMAQLQAFLTTHDSRVPLRIAWLAWSALSRATGNDELAVARARDRMLARLLERGLVIEHDLPAFLRFAGRVEGDRAREMRRSVEEVRLLVQTWYQAQTKVDPANDPTAGYIDALFAFAQARLGEATVARNLLRNAGAALAEVRDDSRAAHDLLLWAFDWRVEQLIAGRPHAGPLPREWHDELARVRAATKEMPISNEYDTRRSAPYAVERLREQSRVLEPGEKFDPYRHTRHETVEALAKAKELADWHDAGTLRARIRELLRATANKPALRLRVLSDCVPLTGRLGADAGGELLGQVTGLLDAAPISGDIPELITRFLIAEQALFFAAHFDRGELTGPLVERMLALFNVPGVELALEEASAALGQLLRGMRKLGRREETERILISVTAALLRGQSFDGWWSRKPRGWAGVLNSLLHVAAGWIGLDQPDLAEPILAAARRALSRTGRPGADTLLPRPAVTMACNYIAAVGMLKPSEARQRIDEVFEPHRLDRLPNTMTTGVFYSLFHLNLAEAAVLTLSSDDFALGPTAKRWLDEDEHLIRRHIHAEVRAALERG